MYRINLINPLFQFGTRGYTLIFEDEEGVYPPFRTDKRFAEAMSDSEMAEDVRRTIEVWAENDKTVASPAREPEYEPEPSDDLALRLYGSSVAILRGRIAPDLSGAVIVVDEIGGTKVQWPIS